MTDDGLRHPALSLRDLHVQFGGRRALDVERLDIDPGTIVGVIGPNGAGKTTLLDAVSGFVDASAASVLLDGTTELRHLPSAQRARLGIGRTFQESRLFPSMRVHEILCTALEHASETGPAPGARRRRRSRARLEQDAGTLVDRFGLDRFAELTVGELSTGTRRLVELACTRARNPRLALLDEPSAGIARAELGGLAEVLRSWRDQEGCALVVVEHDLAFLGTVADEVVVLGAGQVVAHGPQGPVLERYAGARP